MDDFDKKVQSAIKEMIRIGYKPTIFMTMVFENGSVEAVKRLLHSRTLPDGFTTLFEKGRLDLSMENIVYSENWGNLFTEEEISIAKKRLLEYKYLKEEK
jgi:hypothetical protein